jgi:photosystem II stability/assembly factor-like uncharacterized protein
METTMRKKIFFVFMTVFFGGLVKGVAQPQWQLQTMLGGNPALISVKAVSRDVAWICGPKGAVYRTSDGGKTWSPTAEVPAGEDLACIEVLDDSTAFIGGGGPNSNGGNAKIYRTRTRGQNWEVVYTATGLYSFWNGIHFFDAQNGIAFGDPPSFGEPFLIVKTVNGGTTWTPIANPPMANVREVGSINSLYFSDAGHGWFGTARSTPTAIGGRVFCTTDSGNTWDGFASGNPDIVWAVRFISPTVGIRTSSFPPFLTRSSDGGKTWTPVNNLPVSNIQRMIAATGIKTPSLDQLWVYGEMEPQFTPFILSSADSGITWIPQTMSNISGNSIYHMSAVGFGAGNDSVRAWGVTVDFNTFTSGGRVLAYLNPAGFLSGVRERARRLPTEYTILQNYPNPFNLATKIEFQILDFGWASLKVYDARGGEVATLVNNKLPPGSYAANFDATGLASGIYFYRFEAGNFTATRKMILIK